MGKVTWYQAVVCVGGEGCLNMFSLDLPPLLKRVFMGDILEFLLSFFQTGSYLSIYLSIYLSSYLHVYQSLFIF